MLTLRQYFKIQVYLTLMMSKICNRQCTSQRTGRIYPTKVSVSQRYQMFIRFALKMPELKLFLLIKIYVVYFFFIPFTSFEPGYPLHINFIKNGFD